MLKLSFTWTVLCHIKFFIFTIYCFLSITRLFFVMFHGTQLSGKK